jgi:thioredoxin-dependent peroxiredoxin
VLSAECFLLPSQVVTRDSSLLQLVTCHSSLVTNKMFDQKTLHIGDPAPELKLKDQHGNLVFLRDYAGRWVILYFYPKDDTPGCTREACNFRDESQEWAPFNAQVLGVSVDSCESHERFARKFGLKFPLLADPTKKVTRAYGALAFYRLARRMTFIIDPAGKIRKIFSRVNPKVHAEEVAQALRELQTSVTSA